MWVHLDHTFVVRLTLSGTSNPTTASHAAEDMAVLATKAACRPVPTYLPSLVEEVLDCSGIPSI
jgi:hypothetical protein